LVEIERTQNVTTAEADLETPRYHFNPQILSYAMI